MEPWAVWSFCSLFGSGWYGSGKIELAWETLENCLISMLCPALKLSLSVGWMKVESGSGKIELIWERTESWFLSIGCPCAEDPWPAYWKWGLLWRLGVCGEGLRWRILGGSLVCWVLVFMAALWLILIGSYPSLSSPSGPALELLLSAFSTLLSAAFFCFLCTRKLSTKIKYNFNIKNQCHSESSEHQLLWMKQSVWQTYSLTEKFQNNDLPGDVSKCKHNNNSADFDN